MTPMRQILHAELRNALRSRFWIAVALIPLLILAEGEGRTIVLTSHDMGDVDSLCDHAYRLNCGTIQCIG